MLKPLRRLARRGLEVTGLIGPYYRFLERRLARAPSVIVDDGRPMPPPDLLVTVVGTAGQDWFSQTGRRHAQAILRLAGEAGLAADGPLSVLDWGCGCGRLARWIAADIAARGGEFQGCDLNPKLVAWCRENLPGRYFRNGLKPPLSLPDASVDLVYAYSVLTHLTEPTTRAWLRELRRVLRPGGIAVLTYLDEAFADRLGPPEVRAALSRKPFVVWNNALEGSNYMSAWIRSAHWPALAAEGFEVVRLVPGGENADQTIAVLRAR
jgi:SAM-dependent methyltransferase